MAGMVIRKKINTHIQCLPVSFSISAARLIYLQLSRLVEEVRGNVVGAWLAVRGLINGPG